ncbi:hypothetical protein NUU61_001198 [Penicillium alfredii]|uniref:LisH domain-containing protein n=1 Tax=Penicillium alfredii TaxID=1506179 RepID=A0A9W9KQF9_9EURO|nr:uncharacterized protein NUU61_001198 [Penicillium alfredii]KAJ5115439.1 hypothetical protein NUU61_001198 [Penicillium alfredii]
MAPTTAVDALASALVARFLRTNDYSETLQAFIHEAGLRADVGQTSGDDTNHWTIQSLLEEKRTFEQSVSFERYGADRAESDRWSVPAPSKPTVVQTPTSANLLAASVELWQQPRNGGDENAPDTPARPYIISTGADRQVHLLETVSGHSAVTSFTGLSDSPVLSYVSILQGRYVLMTNMSGQLLLQHDSEILDRRKDHSKYAVKVTAYQDPVEPESSSTKWWVATAGWDATIFLYRLDIPDSEEAAPVIGEPAARVKLATNPESLLFVRHVDSDELLLLASRRDSTYIYYYQVQPTPATNISPHESGSDPAPNSSLPECRLLGKQNLAPHSNAWVAFSPAHMALSPNDPGLLAVATSALPHLKVIIVRLLFPWSDAGDESNAADTEVSMTQASQALASLALQNREDAAILVQANSFAPQTAYSTPQVAWRPDGSGIWVNGDDGVVRGIETKTGKVVALLKNGHEPGCKVRTIWAGHVSVPRAGEDRAREEWVISGGFDKRLIVWKVE